MSTLGRKFIAVPARAANETWRAICELVSKSGSAARKELESVAGIASSLIAREAMTSAIVLSGVGDRVRIYCLYHEDAISGEDANETRLPHDPTNGDWEMSLPCPEEDLDWVKDSLREKSKRITARDMAEVIGEEATAKAATASDEIDLEGFLNL
jgi:hypothetical protein